jgi:predicted SAM-dependent methyltransferase
MNPALVARLRRAPVLFHLAKAAQAALTGARRAAWSAGRDAAIARYLAAAPAGARGLTIGAGHHPPPGWLATDLDPRVAPGVVFLDATAPFPFADGVFDRIHSEHMIEHVPLAGGRALLAECARVLRPGGRLRLATPDLARLAGLVAGAGTPEGRAYVAWIAAAFPDARLEARPVDVLNHGVRAWGHVFLYDEATLRDELARAGFRDVQRWAMNASDDPALRRLETHAQTVGGEEHVAWETMVLEAAAPARS